MYGLVLFGLRIFLLYCIFDLLSAYDNNNDNEAHVPKAVHESLGP